MPEADRDRWQALSAQLDELLGMTAAGREARLAELATADGALAARLRTLLGHRAGVDAAGFLEGQADPAALRAAPALLGRTIGPYVIEAEIAQGGMGSVWRARRSEGRLAGLAAVKFVHAGSLGSEGERRFRREGELLSRLNHPNIARLLDAGVLDGHLPYLLLEYVEGEPIDAYCRRLQLDARARVRLLLSVCRAVGHAHGQLIVHRDLKPSNVLVTNDGTVKLLDFGIAKLLHDEADSAPITRAGSQAMTPEYAAPEQLLGHPVTTATDVFALGTLAYLVLSGRHPAALGPGTGWMRDILERDPPPASAAATAAGVAARELQGDLDTILAKALKKDPAERYESVGALADDFARHLDHQAVLAAPDTVTYRVGKFVRRHRGGVLVAMLATLALLLAAAVTTLQMFEARRQRDLAEAALRRAEGFNDLLALVLSVSGAEPQPLSTSQLLDRAERLVHGEFAADDGLRAHLLYSLARIESQASGGSSAQRALYAEAAQAARRAGDARLSALASCALTATDAVRDSPIGADARIAALLAGLPADAAFDEVRAGCWQFRSTIAAFAGDGTAALAAIQRAAALDPNAPTGSAWGRLSSELMLADAQRRAGHYRSAEASYTDAWSAFRRLGIDETAFGAVALSNWGINEAALGRPQRAAQLLEQVMAMDRRRGGISPFTSVSYAAALVQLERLTEARSVLEEALARAAELGNGTGANMIRLGLSTASREAGDLRAAAGYADAAERGIAATLPPGHEAFGSLHASRAALAARGADLPRALHEVDAAMAIFAARPALALRAASTRLLRSRILLDLGRPGDALAEAQGALRTFESIVGGGERSAYIGLGWSAIARARLALHDSSGARTAAGLAYDHLLATVGAQHSVTREVAALRVIAP